MFPERWGNFGFNGAAHFLARKLEPLRLELRARGSLQWGRAFSSAEIVSGARTRATSNCFNGAAHFLARKSFAKTTDDAPV